MIALRTLELLTKLPISTVYQKTLHQPREGTVMVFLLLTRVLVKATVVVVVDLVVVLEALVEAASVALVTQRVVELAAFCTGL